MWLSELIKICMVVLSEIGRELVHNTRGYRRAGSEIVCLKVGKPLRLLV